MSDENRTAKNDSTDGAVNLEKPGGEQAADAPGVDATGAGTTEAGTADAGTAEAGTADNKPTPEVGASVPSPAGKKGIPPVVAGALVAVAAVLVVLVGSLAYGKMQDSASEAARTDALKVAEEQSVAMLAYDYGSVDEQLASAADGLTGDFREEYLSLMNNIIAPGAKEKQISVQVAVQGSSVVSAEPDRVVALLFLNQITTSSENPEAVSSGSRVRVELENQDGRWLVSRLTPI